MKIIFFNFLFRFSHLYRSSSFNSSGRSSNCDNTCLDEDMFSDVSLEDVQDLNQKLEALQRQISNLADDRTSEPLTRAKTEYAVLQTKYHMLEDQLRETELRSEERLVEEQKRYRELTQLTQRTIEREAELKNENCQIRVDSMDSEITNLREEVRRLRLQCDKHATELRHSEDKLESTRFNLSIVQENLVESRALEKQYLFEKNQSEQHIAELHKEIERIRTDTQAVMTSVKNSNLIFSDSAVSLDSNNLSEAISFDEIQNELENLRGKSRLLQESNDELQAMLLNKNVEEGQKLLNGGFATTNLADELREFGHNQVKFLFFKHSINNFLFIIAGRRTHEFLNTSNQIKYFEILNTYYFL